MLTDLEFNLKRPTLMHVDFNSCFASIEQQANPLLRGKPLVVVPYLNSNSGCVLTASREARVFGVKTGMRLVEARKLCPGVMSVRSDPAKYRFVHNSLRKILETYTNKLRPKSIDEFVMEMDDASEKVDLVDLSREVKWRIKKEIGEWLTVSIGIGPNTFLAKTAAGMKKPDGLEVIDVSNYREVYKNLNLTDLCGINTRLALRLNLVGIKSVNEMYEASPQKLREAFRSVTANYWYLKLRGYEVEKEELSPPAGGTKAQIKSFGQIYSLPSRLTTVAEWMGVLAKLSEKAAFRMRKNGAVADSLTIVVSYRDGSYFKKTIRLNKSQGDFGVVGKLIEKGLAESLEKTVRSLAVTYHGLSLKRGIQGELIGDVFRREKVVEAVDKLKEKWGSWVIMPAVMIKEIDSAPEAISFGNIR